MQHATDAPIDPVAPRAAAASLRDAENVVLSVAGMGCPSCANRIRNALLAHPGVVDAEVDVPAALARVWYTGARVTLREILAIVATVGEGSQHRYLAVPLSCDP